MRIILLPLVSLFFIASNDIKLKLDSELNITIHPLSLLECEGNSVRFKVVATGLGLTYTWQRKRPEDSNFVTITDGENNTDFSQTDNVRIGSVGSAQYPNGTQFRVIVSDEISSVISNIATLTVNEITSLTGGTNITQCFGTNYSYIVTTSFPANVVSYRWKKLVTSGVWDEIHDGGIYSGTTTATLNITGGTPAESGEYRVYITFNSSGANCNTTSASRTRKISFLPQFTMPETTITQPNCVKNTGTIAVAVQSTTDVYSFDNGLNFQASNEKSGLAAGSYNVIIKNTAGCVSPNVICPIIEVGQDSIWDGAIWLNGDPESNRSVVFEQNFSSVADIEACSCQIANEANVVINGAHTLKVVNALNVVSGSLTFENNASLVQLNDNAVNTGNIIYKRSTTPVNRYDYTYWSSPVAGMTLEKLSPATFFDKYFSYNNAWVSVPRSAAMDKAVGYNVRAPQTNAISDNPLPFLAIFEGVPHNGLITLTALAGNQAHLLGNPYPSAIDADVFIDLNSNVLEGTLYFWTHNSPPSDAILGDKKYNYTTADYAIYNRTGGVGTGYHASSDGIVKKIPTGNIAAGQGFFAPTKATGDIVFNNSMRISGGSSGIDNSQFFKLNTVSKTEKNRIWLNLTNKEGAFKQILIGYITGATNNFDNGFDGVTYDGNPFVDFYSVNQGVNLTIQGRALPFHNQDSVALGYKSTIKGEFQISIDQTDGVLDSQQLFIQDNDLQILHDLKKEPYEFVTENGVFNNRFVLRYLDVNAVKIIEDLEVPEEVDTEVIVSVQNDKIKINSPVKLIDKVVFYDMKGRKIYQRKKIAENVFNIHHLVQNHQVLVVRITLETNETLVKKILP